jgi:hypothetical protein
VPGGALSPPAKHTWTRLENQKADLLAFARDLDQQLQAG